MLILALIVQTMLKFLVILTGALTLWAFVAALAGKEDTMEIIWQCDCLLRQRSHTNLSWVTRRILKALTSIEDTKGQYEYIRLFLASRHQLNEILQREIYLLEGRESLREKAKSSILTRKEEGLLERVEQELDRVMQRVWMNRQAMVKLQSRSPGGVWIAEYNHITDDERWEHDRRDCIRRLGCCSHSCGCCDTPRRVPVRGHNGIELLRKTHCTMECGCCIRWRGFRRIGEEEKDLIEATEGGSTAEALSLLD
ncbi:hypothetical protein MW887_001148 [Aspergillus wentii]|nr:hypothetical protein MW887_001148 [Aspergillus wentii]